MFSPSKVIDLSLRDNDHCKRLKDPYSNGLFHLEAWIPFSEAGKLDRGNANVRPASEKKKPFKAMIDTVENDPTSFHLKNRGIIYRCDKFEYDNTKRSLRVTIPNIPTEEFDDLENGDPKFGIADGGHTFEVILQTNIRSHELQERGDWSEPYVRVHFLAGDAEYLDELEQVVEALNTSSQVQQFTLDEYQNKFDDLKEALKSGGFDSSLIAFRENEDKDWDIREIVQRMACFLKDRWKSTQPASMYKSKGKALDLYTNEATREEFIRLFDVARDIITLPEYIESQFSVGDAVKGRKFGNVRYVKKREKQFVRPGTDYATGHKLDLAASLPIAAAFRELLELKGNRYFWKVDYKLVFHAAAEELYKALLNKSRTAKAASSLGSDTEYWTQASNIVLRAKDEVLSQARSGVALGTAEAVVPPSDLEPPPSAGAETAGREMRAEVKKASAPERIRTVGAVRKEQIEAKLDEKIANGVIYSKDKKENKAIKGLAGIFGADQAKKMLELMKAGTKK